MAFDLWAGSFQQFVVLDARRTGCDTGHTAKAGIEVAGKVVRDRRLALKPPLAESDSTPRRVGFSAPQDVGRAGRQTEAAVNTIGDERRIGWVVTVKRRLNYRHDAYAA